MPIRPELSRRGALLAAGAIAAAAAAGCGDYHARLAAAPPRPVTVALDAPASALFAPLYAAQAAGQFRAGALAVRITPAPGAALLALEQRNATFAITSEPALLAARDAGNQLVAVAQLVTAPLDGVLALASRPLGGVRALAGHSVATAGTPLAQAELATVLATARIPTRRVKVVTASGGLPAALTSRHAIAALGGPWPVAFAQLAQAHHPATVLGLPALGVPGYSGLVVVVRVGEARHDGPLLRAFLQSLTRGQRAVAADPQAAAQAVARAAGGGTGAVRFARAVLDQVEPLAGSLGATAPWGFENATAWRAFGAWMRQRRLLHGAGDPARAITNEFLPGQGA